MSNLIPELEGWEDIEKKSATFNVPAQSNANILALKKIVNSVVNLRFAINALQGDLNALKVELGALNENIKIFNQESSKYIVRTFWTNFFIAIATFATAIAAFIAIFYKR